MDLDIANARREVASRPGDLPAVLRLSRGLERAGAIRLAWEALRIEPALRSEQAAFAQRHAQALVDLLCEAERAPARSHMKTLVRCGAPVPIVIVACDHRVSRERKGDAVVALRRAVTRQGWLKAAHLDRVFGGNWWTDIDESVRLLATARTRRVLELVPWIDRLARNAPHNLGKLAGITFHELTGCVQPPLETESLQEWVMKSCPS